MIEGQFLIGIMISLATTTTVATARPSSWSDAATPAVAGAGHENHRGAAWGDYDGDGWIDLYITHWGTNPFPDPLPGSPNQLFHNVRGTLVEVTTPAVSIPGGLSHHPAWGDLDNDGRLDLYVTQSSNFGTDSSHLIRQEPDGSFVDVTGGDPLAQLGILPRNVTWVDYDLDGLLDLYTTNSGGDQLRCRLMRNMGDGTFVRLDLGLEDPDSESRGAAWCDFDNDGLQDVYVASGAEDHSEEMYRTNSLFRNMGDGTWMDVAPAAGVDHVGHGRGVAWGDINNDGWFDLLVGNQIGSDYPGNNVLYLNNGDGTFSDISVAAGISENVRTRCVSMADYDNDGWLDLYVVNFGTLAPPNRLFRNNGDLTFTDMAAGTCVEAPFAGSTAAWCDYDNDGWIDLYAVGGSFVAPGVGQNRLCHNENHNGNHWIELDLVGTVSNRLAIGARVKVTIGETVQVREVQSGSGYNAQHMHRVHFGLGAASVIDRLEVRWPSGRMTSLTDVTADQIMTIGEPCQAPTECVDCNGNGAADVVDIAAGTSTDCNGNGIPDDCDIAGGTSTDDNGDGLPDECFDCNGNGIDDGIDIDEGTSADCNGNGTPDECEIAAGDALDVDGNGVIDACEDCNGNGAPDGAEIAAGTTTDCDGNGVPDECDTAVDITLDCDDDGVLDACEVVVDPGLDADGDGVLDACTAAGDLDGNGAVDVSDLVTVILNWGPCPETGPCVGDVDGDGAVGIADLVQVIVNWG